jgi:hypothetical protein
MGKNISPWQFQMYSPILRLEKTREFNIENKILFLNKRIRLDSIRRSCDVYAVFFPSNNRCISGFSVGGGGDGV